jgi:hypothetical protein
MLKHQVADAHVEKCKLDAQLGEHLLNPQTITVNLSFM